MAGGTRLWLAWSWRDLRQRWLVVAATALVIAMGTGIYASLGNQGAWRRASYTASYEKLRSHDLRLSLSEGAYAPAGKLEAALGQVRDRRGILAADERLVVPTQVDASRPGHTVLVAGRIVGMPVAAAVDRISVDRGRGFRRSDAGAPTAVIEQHFAKVYGLPPSGSVSLGGARVRYVGLGMTPDYFLVTSPAGWGAEASLGVVFVPLRQAQRITGHPGAVNELVVRLAHRTNAAAIGREVSAAIGRALPGTGVTATLLADETPHATLYRDSHNDQKMFNVYAYLLLAGAAFAAFNLVSRVVEAQRRETGIGMALGVPARQLALRPLLMGAEIALLGVLFGIGVGIGFGRVLKELMVTQMPLPVYTSPFSAEMFVRGAALGFALPFLATLLAVRRSVRMRPVDAIQVGARAASGGGLAPLLRRIPMPGRSLAQMPLRNALRAPRRTLLTVLGIAAVLTALVSLVGMIDSMRSTLDRSEQQTLSNTPDRLNVTLSGFLPANAREIQAVAANPKVGAAEPGLQLQGVLLGRKKINVSLELLNASSRLWHPSVSAGTFRPGRPGIVISRRAADQLEVGVGGTVTLRHPRLAPGGRVALVDSRVPVVAIHPNPFRFLAYMDRSQAGLFNLQGLANSITVQPAPGVSQTEVQRALFGRPGVAASEPASALTDSTQKAIDQFLSAIVVTETMVLILALLVAFNSTSISADERRRETATMFAFGVPLRSALRVAMLENMVMGVVATLVGLVLGLAVTSWVVHGLMPQSFPELAASVSLSPGSLALVALVGVGAVTLAPVFTVRRMRRMSIPSTLRVVE